jgi:hypothetical protein
MNNTDLAKYLEDRSFPIALRNYVTQNLMVNKNYAPFADLAECGVATVQFVWNGRTLKVSRVVPVVNSIVEVGPEPIVESAPLFVGVDLAEQKETVIEQSKPARKPKVTRKDEPDKDKISVEVEP